MKKATILKVAILCVVAALLCTGAVGYLLYSPVGRTIQAIKELDCTQAEHYGSKLTTRLRASLFTRALPNALEAVISDYNRGDAGYEDVKAVFNTVQSLSPETDTSDFEDLLQQLTQSKEEFSQGRAAMESEECLLAIQHYEKVIPEDVLYQTAKGGISSATAKYVQQTKSTFYRHIANNSVSQAEQCLRDALEAVSSYGLTQMQEKLTAGVYRTIGTLLSNQSSWATRKLNSGYDGTYYCYSIAAAQNDKNAFLCIYYADFMAGQIDSFTGYSGPSVWYRIQGNRIIELDYEQSKNLSTGFSKKWDRSASTEKKIEFLENLFG